MTWTHLGTQFSLELAFGVLLGLCLLSRAPLGLFFHRLMGFAAALPLMVACAAPPLTTGVPWSTPVTRASGAALLGIPVLAGPMRSDRRLLGAL